MAPDPNFSLSGKTALVTGGGSGIGKAIAHALSDAGASIVLIGRQKDKLLEALETRNGEVYSVDLLHRDAPGQIAGFCRRQNLHPDILVNAAGENPRQSADEISADVWQSTIHLNLSVPFLLAQKLVGHMQSNNWGRIINIASLQSQRAFTDGIAYGAAKGGIPQLTRAMAESWSPRGINANAIAPGFFPTKLTAPVFSNPELAALHANRTAIGRNGRLEDLAGPAVFLASEASAYITGQVLYVDGGYTAK